MALNTLTIPEFCLVLLIGPSGAGKTTFAHRHFKQTEVISSDKCRGMVCDDEDNQAATADAFDLLHAIVEKRLKNRKLAVVDATNLLARDRAGLLQSAKKYHAQTLAVVFNLDSNTCLDRARVGRQVKPTVVKDQVRSLKPCLKHLKNEAIYHIYILNSPEEIDNSHIRIKKLRCNKRDENGPFDIIGDIHGCAGELEQLLEKMGYQITQNADKSYHITAPHNRRVIFLGDLVDRGPRTPDVLRIVRHMVQNDAALCIRGNHENKLVQALAGKDVSLNHGLNKSMEQMAEESAEFRQEMQDFMDGLTDHYVLDGGRLVVAHAGIREDMQGRTSNAVRAFCLYGDTTGEKDISGLPRRLDWAKDYGGDAKVVYGHVPAATAQWINETICIDTACVFGGRLTALRYPEMELVDVKTGARPTFKSVPLM